MMILGNDFQFSNRARHDQFWIDPNELVGPPGRSEIDQLHDFINSFLRNSMVIYPPMHLICGFRDKIYRDSLLWRLKLPSAVIQFPLPPPQHHEKEDEEDEVPAYTWTDVYLYAKKKIRENAQTPNMSICSPGEKMIELSHLVTDDYLDRNGIIVKAGRIKQGNNSFFNRIQLLDWPPFVIGRHARGPL